MENAPTYQRLRLSYTDTPHDSIPGSVQRLLNRKPVRDRIVPLDKVADFLLKIDETENIVQRAFIRFLLFTALRRNEAANLQWADIRDDSVHVAAERNKSKRDIMIGSADRWSFQLRAK